MDPVTAALNFATEALRFASKVWDAMPAEARTQAAADWAKFNHNLAQFVLDVQALAHPKTP